MTHLTCPYCNEGKVQTTFNTRMDKERGKCPNCGTQIEVTERGDDPEIPTKIKKVKIKYIYEVA